MAGHPIQDAMAAMRRRRNRWLFSDWNRVALDDPQTVAVYPRLGVIYNRIKKSGNTTITAFLADLERPDQTHDTARSYKRSQPHLLQLGLAQALRARRFPVVAFVRNPYARVLSAFRDKVGSGRNEVHSDVPGFARDDADGFRAFLDHLASGGLHANRHWWPQSDLLARPVADLALVGKLEHIVEDMGRVMELVGRDPSLAQSLAQAHSVSRHTTGSQARLSQYFRDPASIDLVRRLYDRDFSFFGYSPDDIPS